MKAVDNMVCCYRDDTAWPSVTMGMFHVSCAHRTPAMSEPRLFGGPKYLLREKKDSMFQYVSNSINFDYTSTLVAVGRISIEGVDLLVCSCCRCNLYAVLPPSQNSYPTSSLNRENSGIAPKRHTIRNLLNEH